MAMGNCSAERLLYKNLDRVWQGGVTSFDMISHIGQPGNGPMRNRKGGRI